MPPSSWFQRNHFGTFDAGGWGYPPHQFKQHGRDDQRVVLSVSPVPIQRTFTKQDVIIANTYSKAVLRVAAQQAVEQCDWVDYYPSFEAITLSDPNTSWEKDGIHVRQAEIHRNVERMIAMYS